MPAGSHKYFEQMDNYGDPISVDDPEFLAKVRAKLGPMYENLANENTRFTAANIGNPNVPYNVFGFRQRKEQYGSDKDFLESKKRFENLAENKEQLTAIRDPNILIYGVGAGASPQTFAHEFRHKETSDEWRNRIEDVLASDSRPQYEANLRMFYNYVKRKNADKVPFDELEDTFRDHLRSTFANPRPYGRQLEKGRRVDYPAYEMGKRALEESGILTALPDGVQRYIQQKAAMDRVEQPYLNFETNNYASGGLASLLRGIR